VNDHSRTSVLVCDDTPAKRYVIASWLRRDGYTVLEAETGAQALDIAAQESVDLAVLDVHLPDMSGLDVCERIKADPRTAATPVLHVSAIAVEPEDRSAGLDHGADAYMIDPIEPRELLSTVRSLLRSSVARRDAERLASRLDRLSSASMRINVALNPARVATAAAEGAARILDTESVVLLVEDPTGGVVGRTSVDNVTTVTVVSGELTTALLHAVGDVTIVHAADPPWNAILHGSYDGPWTVVPVPGPEGFSGLVAVPAPAEATDEDRMLLRRVAETASVALANLRVFVEEHRTALTLQRSLLPASLPPMPGVRVAARYKASGDQVEVGGDFFDTFRTDDGRGVVVIGDVQGHSLEAAIVMAELRYSLRAFMHDGHTAIDALNLLNALLLRGHPDLTATVCILVFPVGDGDIEVANAGHIPPLVIDHGTATYLEPTGTLLGVQHRRGRASSIPRTPGNRVVLMTDGLVERRTEPIHTSLDRLADEVADSDLGREDLCDRLMERWGHGEDDICVMVLDLLETD
jgi:DNA-binding response OmpR family regulator/serine phosphatase RsbU (regulator of sigma subunit)